MRTLALIIAIVFGLSPCVLGQLQNTKLAAPVAAKETAVLDSAKTLDSVSAVQVKVPDSKSDPGKEPPKAEIKHPAISHLFAVLDRFVKGHPAYAHIIAVIRRLLGMGADPAPAPKPAPIKAPAVKAPTATK